MGTPTMINFTFDDLKLYLNNEFRQGITGHINRAQNKLSSRIDENQAELRSH